MPAGSTHAEPLYIYFFVPFRFVSCFFFFLPSLGLGGPLGFLLQVVRLSHLIRATMQPHLTLAAVADAFFVVAITSVGCCLEMYDLICSTLFLCILLLFLFLLSFPRGLVVTTPQNCWSLFRGHGLGFGDELLRGT